MCYEASSKASQVSFPFKLLLFGTIESFNKQTQLGLQNIHCQYEAKAALEFYKIFDQLPIETMVLYLG